MTDWWAAVGAAVATHPCSGAEHPIEWRDGSLRVSEHDDPEAEQTLAALGGDVPACIRLRQAWSTWSDDPAFVTLGRRPGENGLGFADPDDPPAGGLLHTPPIRRRRAVGGRRDAFVLLLSLPPAFIDRLVLTAMAAAARQWSDATFRDRHGLRIGASLASRARPALERAVATIAAPGEDVVVHCTPASTDAAAELRAERSTAGLTVTAALPIGWLAAVWGAGLSEIDGHLVTAVRRVRPGGYDVDVVAWVEAGRGGWEAVAEPAIVDRVADVWRVRPAAS